MQTKDFAGNILPDCQYLTDKLDNITSDDRYRMPFTESVIRGRNDTIMALLSPDVTLMQKSL